jgi:multiple sugar transport system substrate-binding protein
MQNRNPRQPPGSPFTEGGPLELYVEQLARIAALRPGHPAYPVISRAFAEAVKNIASGNDVQEQLDQAARRIDRQMGE